MIHKDGFFIKSLVLNFMKILTPFVLSVFASKMYRRMKRFCLFIFRYPSIHFTSHKSYVKHSGRTGESEANHVKVYGLLLVCFLSCTLNIQPFQYDNAAHAL